MSRTQTVPVRLGMEIFEAIVVVHDDEFVTNRNGDIEVKIDVTFKPEDAARLALITQKDIEKMGITFNEGAERVQP